MRRFIYSIAALSLLAAGFMAGRISLSQATHAALDADVRHLDLNIVDGGIYKVRSVVDGDTIVLENGLHLRYNGMDSPEAGRWIRDASPYSHEATDRNISLVEGKRIRLKLASDPIDMHGRIVANIFVLPDDPNQPEIEVRVPMIKEGFAKAMGLGVNHTEYQRLKALQDEAKANRAGMWGARDDLAKLRTEQAPKNSVRPARRKSITAPNAALPNASTPRIFTNTPPPRTPKRSG